MKLSERKHTRDFVSQPSIQFLVLLLLTDWIQFSTSEDCQMTESSDKPCPTDYSEIYKEVTHEGQSGLLCCLTGSPDERQQKLEATNCQATECLMPTSGNLCSTLNDRYINNTKLVYEEVMRDPCTIKHSRGRKMEGAVGLCCRKNSEESVLLATGGAEPHEFPHMAKMTLPADCGGTVYNKRFIITAAHCVVDAETGKQNNFSETIVILGTNIAAMDPKAKDHVYKVKNTIFHEKYSRAAGQPELGKGVAGRVFNDIALLELDRDIKFSDNIKSLEIAPEGFNPHKWADTGIMTGWGTTDTLAQSIYLQKANVILRTDQVCFNQDDGYWYEMEAYSDRILCVGGITDGRWSPVSAPGDSGGPVVCRKEDGKPVHCGVCSAGGASAEDCVKYGDEDNCGPSLYTEVQYFHKWIKKHAGEQDPSTFYQPFLYGEQVSKGKYDNQVHITSTTGKSCGGTLVAPDVVVTAAQCALNVEGGGKTHSDLKVFTGVNDLTKDKGNMLGVKDVVALPGFQRKGKPVDVAKQGDHVRITDNYFTNDLAIVKLTDKVDMNKVQLASLPENGDIYYEGVEVALPRNTSRSGQMLSREFKILDMNECQTRMNRLSKLKLNVKVDRNVLCGVEKYSGGSTCDRELGGGLFCTGKNGETVLCGVQTFRLCEYTIPNGFINMALHSKWARDAMKKM